MKNCYIGFHSSFNLGSPEPGTLTEALSLPFSLSKARSVLGVPESGDLSDQVSAALSLVA